MRRTIGSVSILLLALAAPAAEPEVVPIQAADGFELQADYYDPGQPGPGVLLLHQCNADRSMWRGIGRKLSDAGIHVLAVDYRGYGGSVEPSVAASNSESREIRRAKVAGDIKAAFENLVSREGVSADAIGTGGASCGGPRSIAVAAGQAGLRTMVFLSTYVDDGALAGFDKLVGLPVLAITAEDDGQTTESLQALFARSKHQSSRLVIYKGEAHGHPLFRQDPDLESTIVAWYREHLR